MTRGALVDAPVPFIRLDHADPALLGELLDRVAAVAQTGAFTLGGEVAAFEDELAAYCETDHAIGISSGTEALVLALRALDVGPGDEVILPANSFIATAEAVSIVGATPRLVDVDLGSQLVTAEHVEAGITDRTRCIVPVHLAGATVDLDPILELAATRRIPVVEDACQAIGARYRGRPVGGLGAAGCFSFYPAKNLGAWGDAGAVVTSDPELADRVRLLRSHGERPRYHHHVIGTTARLDALQAAVLRGKLPRLEEWNATRRELGADLRAVLASASVELPDPPLTDGDHVYHLFMVRCERRDDLRAHLTSRGVASAVHYPVPIHRTEAYAHLGLGSGSLPATERLAATVCTLPLFPGITADELERVAEAVTSFGPGT